MRAFLPVLLLFVTFTSSLAVVPGPRQCPWNQVVFYAHERSCDKYYRCDNGTMREELCPDGLVFDDRLIPDRAHCDLPYDIDCRNRPELQPAQSTAHCARMYGVYSHETDCSKFWKCVNGEAFSFICPTGLAYNEETARCEWPDQVERCNSEAVVGFRCPRTSVRELSKHSDPRYPFPGDCRKFYVCVKIYDEVRMPRLLFCDPPLAFEPKTGNCEKADSVPGCQNYYSTKRPVATPPQRAVIPLQRATPPSRGLSAQRGTPFQRPTLIMQRPTPPQRPALTAQRSTPPQRPALTVQRATPPTRILGAQRVNSPQRAGQVARVTPRTQRATPRPPRVTPRTRQPYFRQ